MMKNVLLIVVSILFITTASAQENRIKVACIGNSITYGYGCPTGLHNRIRRNYRRCWESLIKSKTSANRVLPC